MGESYDEPEQHQLIPGLPDEIALDCLTRVPWRFHSNLKSVCQRWHNLLTHPSFYRERQKASTAEHLVCLVQALTATTMEPPEEDNNHNIKEEKSQVRRGHCLPPYGLSIYNATDNTWQRMMPGCGFGGSRANNGIPMFCQCVALPSSGKILLLGGWDPTTLHSIADVYVFDFIRGGGWRHGAPMSVERSFFACAAVGPSSVYVAGGHDNQKNALRSAEVYDVDADEWRILPDMAEERDECQGLSSECEGDSRFWVVSGYGTETQGRFLTDAECYDPVSASWSKVQGMWPTLRATTSLTSGLWWFVGGDYGEQSGFKEYDVKEKTWKMVARIPDNMVMSSPCAVRLGELGGGGDHHHQMFVMCSGDDDRHGAFILDRGRSNDSKWITLHTPTIFSGFVFSASSLLI